MDINDYDYAEIKNPPHNHSIHRLAAYAFIPNPENKPEINHKNGIRTDNKAENLEWCTRLENQSHARQMGYYLTKLTSEEVREIRASKIPGNILAKKYKVSSPHICVIRNGKKRIYD